MRLAWLRDPIPATWRDPVISAAWLVLLEIETLTLGHRGVRLALEMILVAAISLAAIWRRQAPLRFVAVVLACCSALVVSWASVSVSVAPLYVLIVAPYTVAKESPSKTARIGLLAVMIWGAVVNTLVSPSAGNYLGTAVSVSAAWAAGRWLRARKLLNEELARNAERIDAERESRVRLAVADERTRIARELHALVAVNVSAMVIQAEAAELLLDEDAAAADAAMAAVEQTGRDALSDMRRVLGVLRHTGEPPSLTPQPGIGEVYALVQQARAANHRSIELTVDGDPGPLPASVDLGLYRILEEALAASADGTAVRLEFGTDDVELEIRTASLNGSPVWPTLAMRERASICSGTIVCNADAAGSRLLVTMPRAFEEIFA